MTWAYIILFNDELGARQAVQEFLDNEPEVTYWFGCLPNSVFFTSTLTAGDIAKKVRSTFGTDSGQRFLVVEVHLDREGWLPRKAWHMFRNPKDPILPE